MYNRVFNADVKGRIKMNSYSIETLAVHAGYETDEATMSVTPPLYETNAYVFKDAEHARTLFELKELATSTQGSKIPPVRCLNVR